MRVGFGYDIHIFEEGKPLKLGGIEIPFNKGLKGHSDADVVLHSLIDAMLGAMGEGDIGAHFPDTDPSYKDADSSELLKKTRAILTEKGYRVGNADITIHLELPRLESYKGAIRKNIASLLNKETTDINIKAKTNEKAGLIGSGEGIAATCIISIVSINTGRE